MVIFISVNRKEEGKNSQDVFVRPLRLVSECSLA